MVRVSEFFNLGLGQGALDFVNVDVREDVAVYIDPHALRTQRGDWAEACSRSVSSFFETLLQAIQQDDSSLVHRLVFPLSEPNETHLGQSVGRSRGRSLGSEKRARELVAQLSSSRAIATGMVLDLEETALFVEGIGTDILSDITTCLIREHLLRYTKLQSNFHGIPTEIQFVGPIWNSTTHTWDASVAAEVPRGPDGPLVLVPRAIVRFHPTLDKEKYFTGYIRPKYEQLELAKGLSSEFVYLIHQGKRNQQLRVSKTELGDHLGSTKSKLVDHTDRFPDALDSYREHVKLPAVPLTDTDLQSRVGDTPVDLGELLDAIGAIAPGAAGATSYHRAVAALLSSLFSSCLGNQGIETKLHGGLKRIDITYDNVAGDGFFRWLSLHFSAAIVPIECKNYTGDPSNPELDQIAMRLSPSRGQLGFLITRNISDKPRFRARCHAAASDNHGYIIALDDEDLRSLVADYQAAQASEENPREFALLRTMFGRLLGL